MDADQSGAVIIASMLGTYALLLLFSKRYRDDTAKMFRMEKSSLGVMADHPLAAFAHILSLALPVYLMGLPL
jgi:hypothetical protein